MSADSRSLRGVRGEPRERAIADAVVELIAEVGYERISIDSIAARAHSSKATIYRRWADKAELVAEVLRRRAEGEIAVSPDTGSIRGDLLANAQAIAISIAGGGGPRFLGLVEGIRDDPVLRELVRQQIEMASEASGTALIKHAHARGERIHQDRVPAVFDLLVSHLFLAALLRPDEAEAGERSQFIDKVLLPLLAT